MKDYQDPEKLERVYKETGSLRKAAQKFDCCFKTVQEWMKKHDIERRTPNKDKPPCLRYSRWGYQIWEHYDGEGYEYVRVHRLIAVSEYGFDAVNDMVVHHKNRHKFDNRPENLELLTEEEHGRLHIKDREYNPSGFGIVSD